MFIGDILTRVRLFWSFLVAPARLSREPGDFLRKGNTLSKQAKNAQACQLKCNRQMVALVPVPAALPHAIKKRQPFELPHFTVISSKIHLPAISFPATATAFSSSAVLHFSAVRCRSSAPRRISATQASQVAIPAISGLPVLCSRVMWNQ